MKKWIIILVLLLAIGILNAIADEPSTVIETPTSELAWWDGLMPKEVAKEIEAACMEHFGKAIKSAELGLERKTDLFVLREYQVLMEGYMGYYRAVTRNWYEGEPERELHPREYLTAIKSKNNVVVWRAE